PALRPRPGVRGCPGPGGRPGAGVSVDRVQVVDGPGELAEAAARAAVADLEAAVEAHGTATWVLTGGGGPGDLGPDRGGHAGGRLPAPGRPRPARRGRVGPGPGGHGRRALRAGGRSR